MEWTRRVHQGGQLLREVCTRIRSIGDVVGTEQAQQRQQQGALLGVLECSDLLEQREVEAEVG